MQVRTPFCSLYVYIYIYTYILVWLGARAPDHVNFAQFPPDHMDSGLATGLPSSNPKVYLGPLGAPKSPYEPMTGAPPGPSWLLLAPPGSS